MVIFFAEGEHVPQDFAAFRRVIFPPAVAPDDDAAGVTGKLVCEFRIGGFEIVAIEHLFPGMAIVGKAGRAHPPEVFAVMGKILQQEFHRLLLRLAVEGIQRALLIHAVARVYIFPAGELLHGAYQMW